MATPRTPSGDTMKRGEIIIHGSSGDATGYAMRAA
jgi:formylmethanofuran dehydrogenase subunit C